MVNSYSVIHDEHFVRDPIKGFQCVRNGTSTHCLPNSKGRPHAEVGRDTLERLRRFYAPENEKFFRLINRRFNWFWRERERDVSVERSFYADEQCREQFLFTKIKFFRFLYFILFFLVNFFESTDIHICVFLCEMHYCFPFSLFVPSPIRQLNPAVAFVLQHLFRPKVKHFPVCLLGLYKFCFRKQTHWSNSIFL